MTLVMKKFTMCLSRKPKPNRKPRFFLQNLPKPTDRKHFETVTTLQLTLHSQFTHCYTRRNYLPKLQWSRDVDSNSGPRDAAAI